MQVAVDERDLFVTAVDEFDVDRANGTGHGCYLWGRAGVGFPRRTS